MFRADKSLWLAALALLALAVPAQAQTAFAGRGMGFEIDETPVNGGILIQYAAAVKANPIGEFIVSAQHVVLDDGTLTNGQMTLSNGNGDQIFLTYQGMTDPDGDFLVTATINGGSGQFQAATGSATIGGQDWGNGQFGVIWSGTISY